MSMPDLIYNSSFKDKTLYLNIKTVTEYPTFTKFNNDKKYSSEKWVEMAERRYGVSPEDHHNLNKFYQEKACYLPEFSKIIGVAFGGYSNEKEEFIFKSFVKPDEIELIKTFNKVLDNTETQKGKDAILCGHNMGYIISTISKRVVKHREKGVTIPNLFVHNIHAKPWEQRVVDTVDLWKFGGNEYMGLDVIAEFMGFGYEPSIVNINENYWGINDPSEADSFNNSLKEQMEYELLLLTNIVSEIKKL